MQSWVLFIRHSTECDFHDRSEKRRKLARANGGFWCCVSQPLHFPAEEPVRMLGMVGEAGDRDVGVQHPTWAWWFQGNPWRGLGKQGIVCRWGAKLLGGTHKENGEQRCQRPSKDLIQLDLAGPCQTCLGGGCWVCVHVCVHVHT